MAFIEERLPVDVERGLRSGPTMSVNVLTLRSGHEKRNRNWSQFRHSFDCGYGIQNEADYERVLDFYMACGGPTDGFRIKDWRDFEVGPAQQIGAGDDSTVAFQVIKSYTKGAQTHNRTITKIVNGTYLVYLDGVLQTEGGGNDYAIDITTGVITFNTAPASTGGAGPGGVEVVTVTCEFDVPVRFVSDEFPAITDIYTDDAKVKVPSIPLIELLPTS